MENLVVGIDLGTTNCAVAYTSTGAQDTAATELFYVAQLVNPGELVRRKLLPSFLYLPTELDFPKGSLALPWDKKPSYLIGELARSRGAENPYRLVASAKSWLCHDKVNRMLPILPWQAPEDVPKISPVDASMNYLSYLRLAWDYEHPETPLAEQDVLITVPASFDEAARNLTLKAAEAAGLKHITLLEEPQAAFYSWLDHQGESWRRKVKVGDLILVCDIGGGTTDFTLISVAEEDGELQLRRIAVGEHILLGGDNMDLALAYLLERRFAEQGHKIDSWQLHSLWYRCRIAKERLLENPTLESEPVTILGKGSRLVGGTITGELTKADLEQVLLEGFFPLCNRTDLPVKARRGGLQEIGLPYAADAAITKHLAKFLSQQDFFCPTHVLFNGGVMKAESLCRRVVDVLNSWLAELGREPVKVLESADLDTAVARGAAYYGRARRGRGVRIRAGAARTYYIGIESSMPAVPGIRPPIKALCVVPHGMEEGTSADVPNQEFALLVGEPAEFRFFSSIVRRNDKVGELIEELGDEILEMTPLEVTLQLEGEQGRLVPVRLEVKMTEVGTLELWCVTRDGKHRWKLEFNVREQDE
ncbi:MAG: Hsp70 family protein [Acidobacteriota bacterium]|nr:Hsp70 family protein [Blastocatellia bacterium]MDW8412680.1 Hsp70 family protein [Acidobacteriota bacterium]